MLNIKIKSAEEVKMERMQIENEILKAKLEQANANVAYVAMMADVDIPNEEV